ncbi:MAG: ABC transporter permease, partial [Gemmatimonadota bacterium]
PVFTLAAVTTLALGIGLNAATFSAVHGLLLRPLPGVREPDRLVQLYRRWTSDFIYGSNSIPHYHDLRDRGDDVFESVAAWSFQPLSFSSGGRSERLMGMMVSANFFQTFGVQPAVGRAFIPGEEDTGPGAHPVVVLGHGFWESRFGADPSVIGRSVQINGHPFEVVGVAPADFKGPLSVAAVPAFVPLVMQREVIPGTDRLEARGSNFLTVHARLRDGVTEERAREAMDALHARLIDEFPEDYDDVGGITLVPQSEAGLHPMFRNAQVGMSAVMMAVVGLLLLIACVNVANLFLARARERRKEMGIRLSLGARRGRLVRQLLTESLLFALVSGAAGLALAGLTVRVLNGITPPVDGPWAFGFSLDTPVLLFTLGVAMAAGLLFGMAPAVQASRSETVSALRSEGSRSGSRSRLTRGLVVAQMALSLLLLVSSGLFLRSLQGATELDKGFEADNLLLASVDPGLEGYERDEAEQFWRTLIERVEGLPGVRAAGVAEVVPLGMTSQQNGVSIPGYEFAPDENRSIDYNLAGPGYFEAMGVDLVQGRSFRADDTDRNLMVVNQRMADRFWPGESAIGKTVSTGSTDWTVIGVAETGKYQRLGEDPLSYMYFNWPAAWSFPMTLHVRTDGDPAGLTNPIRNLIRELDPDLPVYDVRTMENHLGLALLPARLGGIVLGIFGFLGLFLAAVGIYGVMAYSVAQRRGELGIRVALGADRRRVVGMVLREGMVLALIGAAIGLAAAGGAARLVEGLLYGVDALDPVSFVAVPLILLGVAALAVYVPARRAASLDPSRALRAE